MKIDLFKILGRGFFVAVLTLSSVTGIVYHDDAVARSDRGEQASMAKGGNASDTGKQNANERSGLGGTGGPDGDGGV